MLTKETEINVTSLFSSILRVQFNLQIFPFFSHIFPQTKNNMQYNEQYQIHCTRIVLFISPIII